MTKPPVPAAKGSESREPREAESRENLPNPVWFKPIMFGFILLGLAWIIVYYLSQGSWPIPGINEINIAIGFGLLIISSIGYAVKNINLYRQAGAGARSESHPGPEEGR